MREGAAPSKERLSFDFAGCHELMRDETCVFEAGVQISLFFPHAKAAQLAAEGSHLERVAVRDVLGGARLTVLPGPLATRISVTSPRGSALLALRPSETDPAIERARELRKQGEFEKAQAVLAPLLSDPSAARRAYALSLSARIRLAEHDVNGALAALGTARQAAEGAGLRRLAALNSLTIGDTLSRHRWDFAGMRAALELIDARLSQEHLDATLQRATAALMVGDLRSALALSESCQSRADQLDLRAFAEWTAQIRLLVLRELGRLSEARAVAADLETRVKDKPCELARLEANVGWLELASGGNDQRALAASARAVELYRSDCKQPRGLQNALVNLALAELNHERVEAAAAALGEARTLGEQPAWVAAWAADIEAQISLVHGDARRAEALYRQLLERTAVGAPIASHFRALVGLARALRARGKLREAAAELSRAEDLLDAELARIPLGEGRESFVGSRLDSAQELVEILLLLDEPGRALMAARRARVRPLRVLVLRDRIDALDAQARATWDRGVQDYLRAQSELTALQKQAWSVPLAELAQLRQQTAELNRATQEAIDAAYSVIRDEVMPLPEPDEGVLSLYYFPLREGRVLFATYGEQLRVERLANLPPSVQPAGEDLLAPVAGLVRLAKMVRVVPYGALAQVSFHALPFDAGIVSDHVPVTYGLDLRAVGNHADHRATALVVINPRGDLPGATREGAVMRRAFAELGGSEVTWLEGSAASHQQVMQALRTADLFHFAGHGKAEGLLGMQSQLWLADKDVLETAEVLALDRVPQYVILSACESGRAARQSDASLGVAQAFILRGSAAVLAPTQIIPDEVGEALARVLYAHGANGVTPSAMHSALLAVRARFGEGGPFAAYRIYTP